MVCPRDGKRDVERAYVAAEHFFAILFPPLAVALPDLELIGKSQCFPLYWYEEEKKAYTTGGMDDLFKEDSETSYIQRDGVTDWILTTARKQYGYKVTKEDIFYYVYGLLHSPDYRTAFTTDLKKSLPRLPLVEKADDFWAFSKPTRSVSCSMLL